MVKSGKFNVTVLKRPSSTTTYPASIKVIEADLSSVTSVTAALRGQDAVVSTVGTPGLPGQSVLIEAAVAAGVKRFLPSDFGCDLADPMTGPFLPAYKPKVAIHKQLREAADAKHDFTYTLVCNNAFLDWGLRKNFLLNWKEAKPTLFNGGKHVFSATTLDSVGQAVVGVLSHPEETKNRFVYVKDIDISQTQLLEIAKKVDSGREWDEPIHVNTEDAEKSANAGPVMVNGRPVMTANLFRVISGQFTKVDNELLGVKGMTEADVEALLKTIMLG